MTVSGFDARCRDIVGRTNWQRLHFCPRVSLCVLAASFLAEREDQRVIVGIGFAPKREVSVLMQF